jgi:hypothetical protein
MPTPSPLLRPARTASTEEVIVSEHLGELRGRVRLLTWVSGLGWLTLVLLGGLLGSGTLDWLLHFDESGTRLVIGLGLLGGSAWMLWQQLIVPLRQQLTPSFLAARVEQRFPGLDNRLVSAVEFLEHRLDAKLGSTELQKVVVAQALKDLETIEVSDIVEAHSVRNVAFASLIVTAMAMLVVVFHPLEAATSVQRLMFPFASVPWPRSFELQLVHSDLTPVTRAPDEPLLIARGDTLELYVQNKRGRLPDRVWFEYRLGDDGPVVRETLRQTTVRDDKGYSRETAVISWIATRGTLQFRVCGGDDHVMPFHRVEVVPPPNIESLQVTITPPSYSQRPTEVLPLGVGHVQGLIGTKVEATVVCDKKLKSAQLRIGERPGIDLAIDNDGLHFTAAFEIKDAAASSYWFELTDTLGFTDREAVHYELRGFADGVPEVNVENPVADVQLTADAVLPVKILAKDDLGLRDVRIAYQVGDDEKISTIPLFNAKAIVTDDGVSGSQRQLASPTPMGPQQHEADFLWKMADLQPESGTRIVFRGEATDDYDLGPPHVGKSVPRTIIIVSRDEKHQELATRVGNLLADLKLATQLQQRAHQQTDDLRTQLEKVGSLRPQDVDQLQRTELDQRQTASRLTNPTDGIESQAKQLLEEFRDNQLTDIGTKERLERLSNELERLDREVLPETERALTQAQKLADEDARQEGIPDRSNNSKNQTEKKSGSTSDQKPNDAKVDRTEPGETKESAAGTPPDSTDAKMDGSPKSESPRQPQSATEKMLMEALAGQSQTLDTLKELQESLAEWRDRRDVTRDFDSAVAEQEAVQKETAEMAQRTMTKSAAELSKQEQAELNKLATRQRKIADQFDQFRKQLEQTAETLRKNDPDSADKFNEAAQEFKNQSPNSKLQDAAQNIADNKMGSAVEAQQAAMDELHEIERMMKRQPQDDTEQFLKQTEEAQQEFQQLKHDQQDLADQAEELAKQPDSPEKHEQIKELMEQQEDLAERMAKAERKLERLRLHAPAQATNRARKRLAEMMKHLQEADDTGEMQQAMEETLDELEQVERELVLEKRIAQERLAFEQLEKIEDELKGLRARQETVIEETVRLDTAKIENESLTRGQLKSLKELAETERSLQHTANQMRQHMASAEVFSLVLKRLARTLGLVADQLGERDTRSPVQALEKDVLRKIDSLLTVLKQEQKKPEKPSQPPEEKPEDLAEEPQEQEERPEEAQPPSDTIPQLAQLKLLKAMQEECLERTEALDKYRDKDGNLPAKMEAEKTELAREQAELADFARNLLAKFRQQQSERKPPDEEQHKPKTKVDPKPAVPDKIEL